MKTTGPLLQRKSISRFLQFLTILSSLCLLALTSGALTLLGIGNWLVKEDPLQHATAIAVLTGSLPARALEAAELYRQGYAKEIWLTHPGEEQGALKDLGIHYPSEDEFNVQVLRRSGVPAKAIRILATPIVNTADELDVIGKMLKSRGNETVIIVTSKSHTRRVSSMWSRYHGTDGRVIVHAVKDDDFDSSRWWKTTGSTQQVLHEVMGIANLWAGFPVRSMSHQRESVADNEASNAPKLLPITLQ